MILDEVQREPGLVLAIKAVVDRERPRRPGRFLLTGSANLLLMKSVADSLAGRAAYRVLHPMTRREHSQHHRPRPLSCEESQNFPNEEPRNFRSHQWRSSARYLSITRRRWLLPPRGSDRRRALVAPTSGASPFARGRRHGCTSQEVFDGSLATALVAAVPLGAERSIGSLITGRDPAKRRARTTAALRTRSSRSCRHSRTQARRPRTPRRCRG